MLKNAKKEITKYKRLPILTERAWKCVFTILIIGVVVIMAG